MTKVPPLLFGLLVTCINWMILNRIKYNFYSILDYSKY
jgi:hypothetical protein